MNITEDMYNMESMKIHDCIRKYIKKQVSAMNNDKFFYAYGGHVGMDKYIDKGLVQEKVADDLDIGDSEHEQAFLHANIDQVLDSDWFNRYIEGEADGRQGEIDKQATDSSDYKLEKNTIASKNG